MKDFTEIEMFATEHEAWLNKHIDYSDIPRDDERKIATTYFVSLAMTMVLPIVCDDRQ